MSLVEKAIENVDRDEAEKMAQKMMKGKFDLEDMLAQLRQIQKLEAWQPDRHDTRTFQV